MERTLCSTDFRPRVSWVTIKIVRWSNENAQGKDGQSRHLAKNTCCTLIGRIQVIVVAMSTASSNTSAEVLFTPRHHRQASAVGGGT